MGKIPREGGCAVTHLPKANVPAARVDTAMRPLARLLWTLVLTIFCSKYVVHTESYNAYDREFEVLMYISARRIGHREPCLCWTLQKEIHNNSATAGMADRDAARANDFKVPHPPPGFPFCVGSGPHLHIVADLSDSPRTKTNSIRLRV